LIANHARKYTGKLKHHRTEDPSVDYEAPKEERLVPEQVDEPPKPVQKPSAKVSKDDAFGLGFETASVVDENKLTNDKQSHDSEVNSVFENDDYGSTLSFDELQQKKRDEHPHDQAAVVIRPTEQKRQSVSQVTTDPKNSLTPETVSRRHRRTLTLPTQAFDEFGNAYELGDPVALLSSRGSVHARSHSMTSSMPPRFQKAPVLNRGVTGSRVTAADASTSEQAMSREE